MKKKNTFKIIWHYLKDDKLSLFLYIFLVVIGIVPSLSSPYFWSKALETIANKDFTGFLFNLGSLSLIYIIFYSLLGIPNNLIYNRLEIKFVKGVSKDLYTKTGNLPAIAFENIGVGEIVNRIYTDPNQVMELLAKLVKMICRLIAAIIIVVIAFKINIILGIEILVFAVVMGFISNTFFPKIKKTHEKIKKESDEFVKTTTENISGIREIKSLGIKDVINNNIFNNIDRLFKHSTKIKYYETLYHNINNLIYFALQFILLATCGYLYYKGYSTYATLIMIDSYLWRIDDVVESLSELGVSYNKVRVSLNRIDEIINNRLYPDEKYGTKKLVNQTGRIEFKDVYFRYTEEEENVLKGLNLVIEPNKKIAVIGRSGNGKSTIFNLLLRYFDCNEGEILIDGIKIEDLSEEELRKNISIIRQTPFIFNLSILDNLKLVKPEVSFEEIKEVCKKAYIDEYIESLPNKYETVIGEGGINLSGGQKQRLAIARTLLLDTKIILFDEATSALDNESQEYIKKTIDDLVKDHTIIIVAHRLSTIVDADVINVIENGKLIQSGKHKELLNTCESYKSLYNTESSNSIME